MQRSRPLAIFSGTIFFAIAGILVAASAPQKGQPEIEHIKKLSRSRIAFTVGRDSIEVFVYAANESVAILSGSYCGGEAGAKEHHGNYQLISFFNRRWVASLPVGGRTFRESRGSEVEVIQFPKRSDRLIAIRQYARCGGDSMEFFRTDQRGNLQSLSFLNKDGSKKSSIYIDDGPRRHGPPDRFSFCGSSSAVGTFCDTYDYTGTSFVQRKSWMYQGSVDSDKSIAEARRSLFEFLSNLAAGNYATASFYYELREKNGPTTPKNRGRLLEQYCKSKRACLSPEELKYTGANSAGELIFRAIFLDEAGQMVYGANTFRARRVDNDFKILDLPPSSSQQGGR